MPFPSEWSQVTLLGTYLDPEGEPEVGKVEFKIYPVQRIKIASIDTIVVPDIIRVNLDESGSFQVQIPSTNDPDISPHFKWHVRERFVPNRVYSYFIEIPHDSVSLDISDIEHDPVGAHLG